LTGNCWITMSNALTRTGHCFALTKKRMVMIVVSKMDSCKNKSFFLNNPNKKLNIKNASNLEIKETKKCGKGVFAVKPIKKGDLIYYPSGEKISEKKCHERINSSKLNGDDPLQIGLHYFCILEEGISRTFNHSCDPNGGFRNETDLYAIKDIKENEEICFDYSATIPPHISQEDWSMICSCESKKCRKIISNISSIPKDQLLLYKNENALQNYIIDIIFN